MRRSRRSRRGITLVEMMLVVLIISLMAGLSFPALTAGIDSLRLYQSAAQISTLLNTALVWADRKQQVVEIAVLPAESRLEAISADRGFGRNVTLPSGVLISAVLPLVPQPPEAPRVFLVYPGGAVPRIGVVLANQRGNRRVVRVDPVSGVTRIEPIEALAGEVAP